MVRNHVEHVAQGMRRKIFRLGWDDEQVRRRQGVVGKRTQGGGAIQDHGVGFNRFQGMIQDELIILTHMKVGFGTLQIMIGRDQPHAFLGGRECDMF